MGISNFLSMWVDEESGPEYLQVNYSLLALIINKGVYNNGDEVEIQLEGLSLGIDQKPFPIHLFYCFLKNSTERSMINKDLQIGQFYRITGLGMTEVDPNEILFTYPTCEKICVDDIPQELATILVSGISSADLRFEHVGSELMTLQYRKHQMFPPWLCV